MAENAKKRHPFFAVQLATPPSHKVKKAEGKALVQNVKLRVAAAARVAEEVSEAMKKGDVELEDFAWEDELDSGSRKRG
jgi:hypothetical protein